MATREEARVFTPEESFADEAPPELTHPPVQRGPIARFLRSPFVQLGAYYLVLVILAALLVRVHPIVRHAIVTPALPLLDQGTAIVTGEPLPSSAPPGPVGATARATSTFLVIVGAILLSIPVAWVYTWTKRLRFDPGLVRSVIILPIAVAGILLVVKNSLAIAFSLAGIVAAVRFRNTLKDPQDAVYIFLTIAIGIAAGVNALDVALVVSLTFNLAVLTMWRMNVGTIRAGRYGRTGVLSFGDSAYLVARSPGEYRRLRRYAFERSEGMEADGLLLVHGYDSSLAQDTVQDALSQTAAEWRVLGIHSRGNEIRTSEYLVRLAPSTTPIELMGTLDDWSVQLAAAEYIPYRTRRAPRPPEGSGAAGSS